MDRAREGDGSLVGTVTCTHEEIVLREMRVRLKGEVYPPYAVPRVFQQKTRVSNEECVLLWQLTELAETRDLNDKPKYGTVTVPADLFLKLVSIWLT